MSGALARASVSEGLGSAFLVAAIVGSGITAQRLSGANSLETVFVNAMVTGAALAALVIALGPVSGAHLNPLITLHAAAQGLLPWRHVPAYLVAQFSGGLAGVVCANAMFGLPLILSSQRVRDGSSLLLGEAVATFGLLMAVWYCTRWRAQLLPVCVGAYIAAAIMFTSSTSFANPAVTVSRSLTNSFAGIAPPDVVPFVLAQSVGALAAMGLARWLTTRS